MVRYRRNFRPGDTCLFTVALADRRSTCLTTHISILRRAFRTARQERPFTVEAIVVLPDHLHAVLALPRGETDFPLRWRYIKTLFTQSLLEAGASLPVRDCAGRVLWQRRYWEHTIRDDNGFARQVDYIHYNPAKHGLVANPADWLYSSMHRFIRDGILEPDWGHGCPLEGDFGEPRDRNSAAGPIRPRPA